MSILPTIKTPPKASLADLTVLVYGKTKLGKCLAGSTELVDPSSGRMITIRELVENRSNSVLTMREAGRLQVVQPSAYIENEPAQLFRLRTQTGRVIEATANHPFLTREGWKELKDLTLSDRVAVVTEYPSLKCAGDTDDDLVKIVAYLTADGSLASGGSPIFTKNDPEVRMEFESAVEAQGDVCVEYASTHGTAQVRVRGRRGSRNNVSHYLREIKLAGLRSADKCIPEFVFELRPSKLRLFLNRLFTCDGSVEASGRVSYSSTSCRMVRQVQHLLARFGIASVIRDRYLKGALYGAELMVMAKKDVLQFIDEIGFFGEKAAKAEAVRANLYNVRAAETQIDRIGPIIFDRIRSIEPSGFEPVYDLTIDGSHNFVANDFVVHNSTFCSHAESALFLATEPGLNSLSAYQVSIQSWDDLLAACAEIAEGNHPFKTIIIDTVDNAYRFCTDYILRKFKVEHEADLAYGKGYALISNEFQRVLTKLAFQPYGLYLISHAKEVEVETRTGKYTRIIPTLPDKARKMVLGMADMVLFCDLEMQAGANGESLVRRVIRTKPSVYFEAGDRTGRLPETLDLDYPKFVEAFQAATTANPATKPAAKPAAAK